MPYKPKKPCYYPLCSELISGGQTYCEKHKKLISRYEQDRESSSKRGYDRKWQKLRAWKLRHDPLCEECKRNDRIVIATEVHHKKSVRLYPLLRLVLENLESLCKTCHNKKKVEENKKN